MNSTCQTDRVLIRAGAWSTFLLPLGVYVASMQRNVGFWDVGEMQTVPYILGIAHPTGFPVFTLAGWVFSHALPLGSVAWRMTLFCAIAMSATCWCVWRMVVDESGEPAIACAAAFIFAFGEIVWIRGTRTEVHALVALLMALTLLYAMRWSRAADRRALFAGGLWWGLAIGTHPVALLLAIGLLALALSRWEDLRTRDVFATLALTLVIALLSYAYLPLRSAQVSAQRLDPTLALGIPAGQPFWDYGHPAQRDGFVRLISGSDFSVGNAFEATFEPRTYIHGQRFYRALLANFTAAGAALILAGAWSLFLKARARAAGFLLAGFLAVPFALGYPEEADIARYFLVAFIIGAVLIGVAAAAAVRRYPSQRGLVYGVLFGIGVANIFLHGSLFEQRFDPGAQAYIAMVRANTPANAIVLAPWTYATPLAYAAYVERSFGDRIVEVGWMSDDEERIAGWLKTRPVYIVYLPWGTTPAGLTVELAREGDPRLFRVVPLRK